MPNSFPEDLNTYDKQNINPAIQLFGRRFFSDQTTLEFLVELLLVVVSDKQIDGQVFSEPLPNYDLIKTWPKRRELEYAPKYKLNLKLFSFLGSSKLDTRHPTHREHLRELDDTLKSKLKTSSDDKDSVLKTLENLFLGFQGAGAQRTWCAQSFVPICSGLIAGESIWQQSKAKGIDNWQIALNYFAHTQSLFLARGGEVLYLQICNALRQSPATVSNWAKSTGLNDSFSEDELNPVWVHKQLNEALINLVNECPKTVSAIAELIDSGTESDIADQTDQNNKRPRYNACGWCPEDSWQEGYLFAVEVLRLCNADMDLIERIELLEIACSMQVLRSLSMQASRYSSYSNGAPVYYWAISDPLGKNTIAKQFSKTSVQAIKKMIYDAIRHPSIEGPIPQAERTKYYKEADQRYGHKLFVALAKRIGLIIPRRGGGMRFVLNERLLRFLVATLIPTKRLTYDSFKALAKAHYGLALDESTLSDASEWTTGIKISSFGGATDDWVQDVLDAEGLLRRLSDSCALVENPTADSRQEV